MTQERAEHLLQNAKYRIAKTMMEIPHQYTLRNTWEEDEDFVNVVMFIRNNGQAEYFYGKQYIYFYIGEYKYWTMGNPVCFFDKTKTILINRARC